VSALPKKANPTASSGGMGSIASQVAAAADKFKIPPPADEKSLPALMPPPAPSTPASSVATNPYPSTPVPVAAAPLSPNPPPPPPANPFAEGFGTPQAQPTAAPSASWMSFFQ